LYTALDTILNNPTYQQNAAKYGQTLKDAGGYMRAADELEAYIGAKQPQLA
jgi:hypothetical protein